MGAWGYGTFDNDISLDLKDDFEDMINKGMEVKLITKILLKSDYYKDCNIAFMALMYLHKDKLGKIGRDYMKRLKSCIEEEKDRASDWCDQQERLRSLDEYEKVMCG